MAHALAHGLKQQAHRLALHRHEALYAQDRLLAGQTLHGGDQRFGIADFGQGDDGAVEILMLMLVLAIVVAGAGGQIVLGGGVEAEDDGGSITPSVTGSMGSGRGASAVMTARAASSVGASTRSALVSRTMSAQAS
jgi:hypothetical protein